MTHTPGPWKAIPAHSGIIDILDPRGIDVVTVYGGGVETESKSANARLIAAAPDLLEALKDTVDDLDNLLSFAIRQCEFEGECDDVRTAVRKARAAIAKAEGMS